MARVLSFALLLPPRSLSLSPVERAPIPLPMYLPVMGSRYFFSELLPFGLANLRPALRLLLLFPSLCFAPLKSEPPMACANDAQPAYPILF